MSNTIVENLYSEELYHIPSRLLIILPKNWNELSEEDKTLLSKILNSVKLTLAHVQITVALQFAPEDFTAFSPTRIISFGSTLKSPTKMYEHVTMNDTSLIIADALADLDESKKKSLWLALKQMFRM